MTLLRIKREAKKTTPPPRPAGHIDKLPRFREGDRVKLVNFPELRGYVMALNTRLDDWRTSVFDYSTGHFRTSIILDIGNFVITYDPLIEWELES